MVLVALVVSEFIYMAIAIQDSADPDMIFMFFQTVLGLAISIIAVGGYALAGFFLAKFIPRWRQRAGWKFFATVTLASVAMALCGKTLGLKNAYIYPETGELLYGVNFEVALASYCGVGFALTNWPIRRKLRWARRQEGLES